MPPGSFIYMIANVITNNPTICHVGLNVSQFAKMKLHEKFQIHSKMNYTNKMEKLWRFKERSCFN